MKTRLVPTFSLIILLVVSCAPQATQPAPAPSTALPSAIPSPTVESAPAVATQPPAATEPPTPAPLPIATSRGPNLEATDPTTVSLASGGFQFVEFFEFW